MLNTKFLVCLSFILGGINVISFAQADVFNLQQFEIDGSSIGDKQTDFLRTMQPYFPANNKRVKDTNPHSLIFAKPVSCTAETTGKSRCIGKFAEMKQAGNIQQKEFLTYRDVVAEFNVNNELSFLSTITTTAHNDKKACLAALSKFYQQTANKTVKPSTIYPRNQLDIYYIKIDEQPFTTRLLGKLDSAFSMVWQKQRGDWSAFYSVDFGCRDSGYMVVNETLYDKARKSAPSSMLQVTRLRTKYLDLGSIIPSYLRFAMPVPG